MPESLKRLLPLILLALLVAAVAYVLSQRNRGAAPDGLIFTNGRLESERIAVASKVPGRIAQMLKGEGDAVQAGEVIARLDDSLLQPKVQQAEAAIVALTAQLAARQAEVQVARQEVPLAVAASQAQRERALAQTQQARRDATRLANLQREGVIDAQHAEQAQLAATVAATLLDQAERQLSSARLGANKVAAAQIALQALDAQLAAARAQLQEAQNALAESTVKAPLSGVIAIRAREPGEVVGAGGTLFELYDPAQLYLRAFVPEADVGKLKLGLEAQVWVDAYPGQAFAAKLTNIANRAEFTPKEVQTHDERTKQVFAVKLLLAPRADVRLAPGLPADATLRYRADVNWQAPK